MTLFSTLLAILKTVPILNDWFQAFSAFYIQQEIAQMKKENREAIRKAMDEHDQRPIEKALGSSKAGKPSGIEGAEIVDELPGVK